MACSSCGGAAAGVTNCTGCKDCEVLDTCTEKEEMFDDLQNDLTDGAQAVNYCDNGSMFQWLLLMLNRLLCMVRQGIWCAVDTTTVKHTVNGNTLSSVVKVDSSDSNMISVTDNGLYANANKYALKHYTMSIPASMFNKTSDNNSNGVYGYRTTGAEFTLPSGFVVSDGTVPPILTARVLGNSVWQSTVGFQAYSSDKKKAQIDVQIYLDNTIAQSGSYSHFPQIIDLWMFVEEG